MKNLILAISILVSGAATGQHWSERYGKVVDGHDYELSSTYMIHCPSESGKSMACVYNVAYKGLDTTKVINEFFEMCEELCLEAGVDLLFHMMDVSVAFEMGILDEDLIEVFDGSYALTLNSLSTDVTALYVDMNEEAIRLSLFYKK